MRTATSSPPSPPSQDCVLRLYVSAAAPSSSRAIVNARSFCEKYFPGHYQLEVLSIADHVAQAVRDEVIAAPTLLVLSPLPVRRFIGDMSNPARLVEGLGLKWKG